VRITALEVDGFGIWNELRLDNFADGLHVFYGPNEAGKTTLLQFVRTVLYGFSDQRRRYLPPLRGGRPGGSLRVDSPSGPVQIHRHLDGDRLVGEDCVELVGAEGTRQGEQLLQVLLGGVDEVIFNNVFAVGLRELQELGTLSDTEAASMLYNLSLGLDRVSLGDVVRELNASRNRLLATDGGSSEIVELCARRERLRAELDELGELTRRYGRLAADQDQLAQKAARLEEEVDGLRHEATVARVAIELRDRWQKRAELDQRLAALGPADAGLEEALERLEATNGRLEKHLSFVDDLRRGWQQLHTEWSGLKMNAALWRLAPRVEVLAEQEDWIHSLRRRVSDLESEISELEDRLTSQKGRFGVQEGMDTQVVRELSPASLAALKEPAKALRSAQRRLEDAEKAMGAARETADTLAEEIQSALRARGETNLTQAMERTGGQAAQLRRRAQMDERLDQMHKYRGELQEQSRTLLDHRVLPAWVLLGLGAVFVIGLVLLFSRLFMPEASSAFGWPLTLLGVVAAVGAVVTKFMLERAAARRLEGCQQQLRMLEGQMRHATSERDALDRQLAGGDPVDSQLHSAESELNALEELVPLDARRRAADQEAEATGEQIREAESRLSAAKDRWRDVLATLGLPKNLSPRQVKGLVSGSDEIVDLGHRLEIRYDELQQRTRELESLADRIARIAAETDLTLEGSDPVEQLHLLVEEVAEQETRLRRRREIRGEARKIRRKRAKVDAVMRRLREQRREILAHAGAKDEQELRRLAARAAQARQVCDQRESIHREIDAALAGHCAEKEVAEKLQAHPGSRLHGHREELRKKLEATEAKLQRQFEKRGQLSEQLKRLVDDRGPAAKRLELATVEKRLEKAIESWQTLAVTSRILDRIRTSYEQDRQPETLREASTYLEQMTRGRYRRVWTPLDQDVLFVDNGEGKSLSGELLSQGTREQLFVALRLAMANSFARRGTRLPIILDDVLVNFDNRRAEAAAALLRDFADEGRQLLVFTCHEHISEIFRALDVPVTNLPDCDEPRASLPPQETTKRRRKRKRKPKLPPTPKPEPVPIVEEVVAEAAPEKIEIPEIGEYAVGKPFEPAVGFVPWDVDIEIQEEPRRQEVQPPEVSDEPEELEFADDEPPADVTEKRLPSRDDEYELAPIDDDELIEQRHPVSTHYALEDQPEEDEEDFADQWLERYNAFDDAEAA
jgi:uncharacterized protein YhaN